MFNFLKNKKLKMVWKISYKDRDSYLVGTTHMFKYKFTPSLRKLIERSEKVLVECSLNNHTFSKIMQAGRQNRKIVLSELVNNEIIDSLAKTFANVSFKGNLFDMGDLKLIALKKVFAQEIRNILANHAHWAAFFTIWYEFLNLQDWRNSMDLEAQKIAEEMRKILIFLEKPEEQIRALEEIPPERIVNFLKVSSDWESYTNRFQKLYLKGKIEKLIEATSEFPTRCESILDRRDPVLFERMLPHIENGNVSIFVGITHIPGLLSLISNQGLKFTPYEI